jgi:ribokinase
MADVVVVGPITWDLTFSVAAMPEAGGSVQTEQMRETVGGKGANPAIACTRLGARTALLGAVGGDDAGKQVRKQLAAHGVDVELIQRKREQATGRIVHVVEPDGRRRFVEAVGSNDKLEVDESALSASLFANSWLLISTALPPAPLIIAAEVGLASGAKIALDLAGPSETDKMLLRYADLVRADADEAGALTGSEIHDFDAAAVAARWLQVRGPATVVVQAGAYGDLLRFQTDEVRVPRRPVVTVDPTGAGDAFVATLVVRLAAGDEPARTASLASASAAHTAAQLGGVRGLTWPISSFSREYRAVGRSH